MRMYHSGKLTIAGWEIHQFEDVSPIENGRFPYAMLVYPEGTM